MTRLVLAIWLCLVPMSVAWSASLPRSGAAEPGTYTQEMDIRAGGFHRSYRVHVPKGYNAEGAPVPLVVLLHGAFSTAKQFEGKTGLSRLADREGFIALYPNGIGLFGLFQHWNSGHCCGKALKDGIDDVGFVGTVIEEVASRLHVDRNRIYIAGHSNGGMLVHRIAAERSGLVAAAAVVSGTIGGTASPTSPEWWIPDALAPVPILMLHGRADPNVPYDGGRGERSQGKVETISVARSTGYWIARNACGADPIKNSLFDGRVMHESWAHGEGGADVELYTLEGWGHDWPGGAFTDKLPSDDPLHSFDAAELLWGFFQRHHRAP